MATAPMIIGMMTSNVNATQMLLWRAVQVALAAALQPVCVWLEARACATMMPMSNITIKLIRTPIMPAPIFAIFYSPYVD